MSIQRVPQQVRRAPLLVLRALYAGFGRALMVADRPATAAAVTEPASRLGSLKRPADAALVPAQRAAPVQNVRDGGAATTARTPAHAEAENAVSLPLPNYDALSLASIRARLRGLDVAELRVLLDYEAVNAERADVLGMLERRIQKLEAGG